MSSGRVRTRGVDGENWRSSNISSRWTTEPGVAARFSPTLYGVVSTMRGMPWLVAMSRQKFWNPLATLAPPVSKARFRAPGFPARVLVGASAAVSSWARYLERARRSQPSAGLSASRSTIPAQARYDWPSRR